MRFDELPVIGDWGVFPDEVVNVAHLCDGSQERAVVLNGSSDADAQTCAVASQWRCALQPSACNECHGWVFARISNTWTREVERSVT